MQAIIVIFDFQNLHTHRFLRFFPILVTDQSNGRVGAPLQCNEIMLVDWEEGDL